MAVQLGNTYDLTTLILLPITAGVIVGLLYTGSLMGNLYVKILAYGGSIIVAVLFIFAMVDSAVKSSKTIPIRPTPQSTRDPFTYDPGESGNGIVIYSGNGSGLPDQYNCLLKSSHTIYEDNKCNCKTGYYGRFCEYNGFDENYVSVTTDLQPTLTSIPSVRTSSLTTWPVGSTVTGCTNLCTANPACLGVTYANEICTQYTSIRFPKAPVQTTLDPPVTDSTLYLNKSRLLGVRLQGYFNIIYGVLPPRYFAGNYVSSGVGTNVHITSGGTKIGYYPAGIQSTFTGIPDWIIVSTTGTLYISTTRIPEPPIGPGPMSTLISLTTPISISKEQFPFTQTSTAYYIRLDS